MPSPTPPIMTPDPPLRRRRSAVAGVLWMLLSYVGDRHIGSGLGQADGQRGADAPCRAGYQGDLSF